MLLRDVGFPPPGSPSPAQAVGLAGSVVRDTPRHAGAVGIGWATLSRVTMPEELPHKVSQIRHDLDDLYELMSEVERNQTRTAGVLHRHGNRLEELQQTLDLHSGRLDRLEDNQRRMQDNQRQMQDNQIQMQDNQHQMQDNQHQMQDNQHRQFDHLSAQIAEILSVLRGPATGDPPPEPEQ